ncbi:MAG: sugar ABC transporter permease [Clostridiaceae bacterium]|nr:sugar ABC transporter permease [Clostridiaceae bacterium]
MVEAKRRKKMPRGYHGYFFILPWLIGLVWFQMYPFLNSFYLAFTNKSVSDSADFVGISNYIRIFTIDPDFYAVIKATLVYTLIASPGKVLFALIIALVLNADIKGINLFRTAYYLPSIFGGSIAISVIWRFLFENNGYVNMLLQSMGGGTVKWFGSTAVAPFTIALVAIWQFGSSMVLFLAALKNVPRELYEAADVDGGSKINIFFSVTLPMISPILLFNLVMQTINCFQEFTTPFVLTKGGPNKSTFLFGMKLYREAFQNFNMGYASAYSWILFAILILVTLLIFFTSRYWVFYGDEKG